MFSVLGILPVATRISLPSSDHVPPDVARVTRTEPADEPLRHQVGGSNVERHHVRVIRCLLCGRGNRGKHRLPGLERVGQILNHQWKIPDLLIVIDEIKQTVGPEGTRDGSSQLLAALRRLNGGERIPRPEVLIAVIVESVSMDAGNADERAGSVYGIKGTRLLLDMITVTVSRCPSTPEPSL
jgi:hypothetical protein